MTDTTPGHVPVWARELFATPNDNTPIEWRDDALYIRGTHERVPWIDGILDLRPNSIARVRAQGAQASTTQDTMGELAFWEATADAYDHDVLGSEKPFAQRRLARMVASVLEPTEASGTLTVEVGTGTGDMTQRHLAAGRRVVCTDLSIDMLRVAKKRLGDNPDVLLVAADILAFPFRDGVFDSAIGLGVLHHIPEDMPAFFRGLWRILRVGGSFAFREPSLYNLFNRYYFDWNRSENLSPNEMPLRHDDMIDWALEAGMVEVKASLDGLVLPQMPTAMAWVAERVEPLVRKSFFAKPLLGGFIVSGMRQPAGGLRGEAFSAAHQGERGRKVQSRHQTNPHLA
ncbi:MAG: class I SAM-dependent methyltransferase [Bradymonadia bacterium]